MTLQRKLGYAASVILTGTTLAIGGCERQEGLENPDITVSVAQRHYPNSEKYESMADGNFITTGFGKVKTTQDNADFQDPVTGVSAASRPIGGFTGRDTDEGDEYLILKDAAGSAVLTIRQKEMDSGFGIRTHREDLKGTYRAGMTPSIGISELEKSFETEEVEVGHWYYPNGKDIPISRTIERGNMMSRESLRYGTSVEGRYDGVMHKMDTGFDTWTSVVIPGGSEISLDGKKLYNVKTISGFGKLLFQGFSFEQDGKEFARMKINADFNKYEFAYDFFVGETKVGTVYLDAEQTDNTKGSGDNERVVSTDHWDRLDIVLTGSNTKEKLASLETIDQIMALMPDQVNMDYNGLQRMELYVDAARFLLYSEGKEGVDDTIRDMALDVAQEEDSTSVFPAIANLVPRSNLKK